ncbi:hypothetical protein BGX27_011107 [Mortierella sp. AM989]|nr:hypothetical protein BGX27_011107 [Mortierella sp. AM989]
MAHPHARSGGRHFVQEYDNGDGYEAENSSDGYLSSSSSSSISSGGLVSSAGSLSPSSYSSDESDSDSDDYSDDDDEMQGRSRAYDADEHDTQENGSSSFSGQKFQFDYYGGRRQEMNEHGGMLPPAPIPAIVPTSNRDALEQEARQRRLERHIDKRRKSLNGNQPPPELIREEAAKEIIKYMKYDELQNTETYQAGEDDEDGDEYDRDDGDGDGGDGSDDGNDDGSNGENDGDNVSKGESVDIEITDNVPNEFTDDQDDNDDDGDTIFSPESVEECGGFAPLDAYQDKIEKHLPLQNYIFDSLIKHDTASPIKSDAAAVQQKGPRLAFILRKNKRPQQFKSPATTAVVDSAITFQTSRATTNPTIVAPMPIRAFNSGKAMITSYWQRFRE